VSAGFPITAYAAINALGTTTRGVVANLREGRTGLGACPLELPFETPTGAMPEPPPPLPPSLAAWDSRTARLAIAGLDEIMPALSRAIARHGADRVAMVVGTTTSGLGRTEDAYHELKRTGALPYDYELHQQHSFGAMMEALRRVAGVSGPCFAVSTACSASAKAVGCAQRLLATNTVDAVLVGGVDALSQTTLRGFHSLQILSPVFCRHLSRERRGINIGEGAAYLLLEREGDATTRLLGVGESSDAHHMSAPDPTGEGARTAMAAALSQAGVPADDVDYINAHSPGTRLNDLSEGLAITALFGGRVPVASTKGCTGHLLGAGGATEAVFSIVAIEEGWIPRSVGADPVDVDLGLNVPIARVDTPCRHVLSNSFAFGGSNVSLLFGKGK
jgi:3-oxoacyl-[acyl-carrier-protein] synthase-1